MNPLIMPTLTRTERQKETSNTKVKVVQLDKNFIKIKTWSSVTEVANFWNINQSNISRVLNSKNNFYKGYYWVYLQDYIEMVQIFNEIDCCDIPVDGFIDFSKKF